MTRRLEQALEGGDPYHARVASEDAVRVAFHAAWTDIDHVLDTEPDLWNHPWTAMESRQAMRGRLASPQLIAAYVAIIPCVEALVRIQLDHRRRDGHDGRWARVTPRLAETFRKQLSDPDIRAAFGPLIEAEIRAGYVGAAAVLTGIARPMASPKSLAHDPRAPAVSGHDGLPEHAQPVMSSCSLHREIDGRGTPAAWSRAAFPTAGRPAGPTLGVREILELGRRGPVRNDERPSSAGRSRCPLVRKRGPRLERPPRPARQRGVAPVRLAASPPSPRGWAWTRIALRINTDA